MYSRRSAVQLIGFMFGASKSYQVRAATVSFGAAQAASFPQARWQQLNLATSRYLTVTASINGAAVSAIIDTGATRSVVNAAWAQRLGLPVSGTLSAAALTRQVDGTLYRVQTLGLGDVVVHDIDISSFDVSAIEMLAVARTAAGYRPGSSRHRHSRGRISQGPGTVEPFPRSKAGRGVHQIACRLGAEQSAPYSARNSRTDLRSEAIVDLGSHVLCSVSESFALEHGLLDGRPTSTTMTVGVEGPSISRIFSLRALKFGPYILHDVPACAVSNWNFSQPVNLGWPCFAAFDFLLDTSKRRRSGWRPVPSGSHNRSRVTDRALAPRACPTA